MSLYRSVSGKVIEEYLPDVCQGPRCIAAPMPGRSYCSHCSRRFPRSAEAAAMSFYRKIAARADQLFDDSASPCHVYCIRLDDAFKFGSAVNVAARFSSLQVGSPYQLSLVGWVSATRSVEKRIHEHLAEHRVRGEWFRDCSATREIVALIVTKDLLRLTDIVGP